MKINFQCLGSIHELRCGETWDSARLEREVGKRVARLTRHTIGRGDIVAISHGGTPAFFADLLALWSLGACAACLNPKLTAGELANVVSFSGAKAVMVARDVEPTGLSVPLICGEEESGSETAISPEDTGALDDPALILFTSGTTGMPKGVVHSFRGLLARIELNRAHMGDGVLARSLCTLPTHFGHGLIGNCLTPLFAGAHLFLLQGMDIGEVARLGEILAKNDITFMSSVPTFWKIALKMSPPPPEQTLKQIHIGSAPLSTELWQGVQKWSGTGNVHNMYGITETANWLAGASAEIFAPEDGLIGRLWGGQAMIINEAGNFQAEGEGELVVQSPALMQGYLHQNDLTAEVLKDGWFRTGDSARIDEEGVIRLTGRLKSEINKAGMKVHPEEIDLLLERHPDIAEACAFAMPDTISGELVGVAILMNPGANADKTALRSWCTERIKSDCVPDHWFFVEAIPKTERGKINRQMVLEACLNPEAPG